MVANTYISRSVFNGHKMKSVKKAMTVKTTINNCATFFLKHKECKFGDKSANRHLQLCDEWNIKGKCIKGDDC